jgi:DNA-binding transcriptional LysR family regulator
MLSLTIRQLEYAVGVARHGSVSAAAVALNVSQPALSVALGQLEAHLGKSLFLRRNGSRVLPTSFGRSFLRDAETLLEAAGQLQRNSSSSTHRPVVLGIFEDLAPLLLGPLLAALKRKYPQIILRHLATGFENLATALQSGEVDLALTYDLGLERAFVRRELVRLPLQAVVHADHPFALRRDLQLREVAEEPVILAEEGLSRGHMLNVFGRHGLTVEVGYSAQNLETMRSLAANGLGVGLSYTRPKSELSYDGLRLHHVVIADADASEPILLVHYDSNTLSDDAMTVGDLVAGFDFNVSP